MWRPKIGWKNPYTANANTSDNPFVDAECRSAYEAGADAMYSAVIKELDEAFSEYSTWHMRTYPKSNPMVVTDRDILFSQFFIKHLEERK